MRTTPDAPPPSTSRVLQGMAVAIIAAYLLGVLSADLVRVRLPIPLPQIGGAPIDLVVQASGLIQQNYVDKTAIDPQKMAYAAIRAMLETLGDRGHTQFLTQAERQFQQEALAGRFGGIGAEIAMQGERPVIVTPIDGTPAQRAGIRPGDVLLQVEDEDTSRLALDQVILKVRGPRGTPVRLTIQHAGDETPIELTIVREEISLRNVTSRYFDDEGILHLRMAQFASGSTTQIRQLIAEARDRGLRGVVMDVRNNPGGLLDQAINVTSEFLADGNVLLEQDRDGNRKPYPVRKGGTASDVPLVVLVNHGSASSSEVFSGAIQDYQRAPIVGERTFGTGTVLSSWELSDHSALLLGFAYWLTPNGRMIRDGGITPDVEVAMPADTPVLTPERGASLSFAEVSEQDPQLGAAFQQILNR